MESFVIPALAGPKPEVAYEVAVPFADVSEADIEAASKSLDAAPAHLRRRAAQAVSMLESNPEDVAAMWQLDAAVRAATAAQRSRASEARATGRMLCAQSGPGGSAGSGGAAGGDGGAGAGGGDDGDDDGDGPHGRRDQQSEIVGLLRRQTELLEKLLAAVEGQAAATPAPPVDTSNDLLTVKETAAFMRTTPKAIYKRKERGELPGAVKVGRRLLVRRRDLVASLAEGRVASPGGSRR